MHKKLETMTRISFEDIKDWLESHPEQMTEYFLHKADLNLICQWLLSRGYFSIQDRLRSTSSRRSSLGYWPVKKNTPPTTPPPTPVANNNNNNAASLQRKCSSKRLLRTEFAKVRSKSFVKSIELANGIPQEVLATSRRRSSLKDLRKYTSLPQNSMHMLSLLIESKVHLPPSPSLQSTIAAKRKLLKEEGERNFFLSIVKDIATELDLRRLSGKVVDNITVLLDAEVAALFLVDRFQGKKSLVSKVADASSDSRFCKLDSYDSDRHVPWGVGILGYVAETANVFNLQDAFQDCRFDNNVDRIGGYQTDSLLCMPVKDTKDEVIAVAQVINRINKDCYFFTSQDEKLLETYLQFVGIALTNARLMEDSRKEYERNRKLLEVVHDLFEEQTSLEKVIFKIMQRARHLLECENAAVLLVDETSEVTQFSKLFELDSQVKGSKSNNINCSWPLMDTCILKKYLTMLAKVVIESGNSVNVDKFNSNAFGLPLSASIKSILLMPIRNKNNHIVGVASIVNKSNDLPFDLNDEHLFEAFTIFCGLGIHNTLMYSEVEKAVAMQKVSLEVLSYHVSATNDEVDLFMEKMALFGENLNLDSLSFDDFSLDEDEMVFAAVMMFTDLGLISEFNIVPKTLYSFLLTVRRNYRKVPYHNWRHAFNVAQVMFAILMGCEMKGTFSEVEVLAMFVGCLCHDLDHRGTNNAFQQKAGSPLNLLYGNTNTMEHHHFNHAVMILSSENMNIFSSLSPENYALVMKVLKHSILSTDLSSYFQCRSEFFALVESGRYSWEIDEHRSLLRGMLMTAADLAASTKPWHIQQRVAHLVTSEFLYQGDRERLELHIQPQALMDRERQHELPLLQTQWINDICIPLYQALGQMNPKLYVMAEGAMENVRRWAEQKENNFCYGNEKSE